MDAGNMLKPMLARGELRMVGATTLDEYREHIEKDAALERRFQQVLVGEPSVEDTVAILRGLKERYEVHHKVRITDAALVAAATLSDRYITAGFLPDKAIDLVDEAASRLRMEIDSRPWRSTSSSAPCAGWRSRRWRWRRRPTIRRRRSGWPRCAASSPTSGSGWTALTARWEREKERHRQGPRPEGAAGAAARRGGAGRAGRRPARLAELRYGAIPALEKELEAATESGAEASRMATRC
jgi:ATP-dependent Clp protease ATP-binding subunit ClpB